MVHHAELLMMNQPNELCNDESSVTNESTVVLFTNQQMMISFTMSARR